MTTIISGTGGITFPSGTTDAGRLLAVRMFTSNGTYIPTTGTRSIVVEAVGGGGAGGGTAATTSTQYCIGGGAYSGTYGKGYYTSGFSGVTLTIGAGGSPVNGGAGGAGGTTSFGSLLVCPGGGGGIVFNPSAASQTLVYPVNPNMNPVSGANIFQHGGYSVVPAVANGAFNTNGGGGNSSFLGTGGSASGLNSAGWPAGGYGGGGGGACNGTSSGARAGGAGAAGVIIVWEYA